jgi:hypothetical protein
MFEVPRVHRLVPDGLNDGSQPRKSFRGWNRSKKEVRPIGNGLIRLDDVRKRPSV